MRRLSPGFDALEARNLLSEFASIPGAGLDGAGPVASSPVGAIVVGSVLPAPSPPIRPDILDPIEVPDYDPSNGYPISTSG
jgi:hypothetical protein